MTKFLSVGLISCLLTCSTEAATLFQIGVPDGDYREFAIAGNHSAYRKQFPKDVNFVVGQSDPARDWSFILPGPVDGWAGKKSHTFTIHFQLPANISNSKYCQLVIDFVSAQDNEPPQLIIGINGEKVEKQLPSGNGDDALTDPKTGKHCSIQQIIPSALLRAGDNLITLTSASGSWALFDDIRLESDATPPSETLTIKAEPMVFFKRTPDGLQRAVNLTIENLANAAAPAELTWSEQGHSGSQRFDLHLGETNMVISVPDVDHVDLALRAAQKEIKIPVILPPAKKWLLYIVPTTHTDIGYTDLQERVRHRHADNGLQMLKWLDQYPDLKWYSETFWQINALLELHPEETDAVFGRLREKRWGLSGDYANVLTGLCSSEALNRLTLDSRRLANRGKFDLDSVILDDVPSAIGALPMVLANSGIKYYIEGANRDRAPYAGNVPNPFYWEGADGSRVLADITTQPGYGAAGNLLPSMKVAMQRIPAWIARFETNYAYDALLINGAYSDNREVQPWLPEVVAQWNQQWEYPKMIFAQPADFYGYIEKNFSNNIPVLKTDFGGWWEDGAGSSAVETALSRRAEERATAAEMLHSLASMMTGAEYPKTNFDDVWHNVLLYNEHTWGAAGSIRDPEAEQTVKQWEVKSSFAHQADAETRELLNSGMNELASMVPAANLVVFNQLAWPRNAVVNTDIGGAVQDVGTKQVLPCQSLPEGGSCFVASDLPSIGYRSYRQSALEDTPLDAVQISGNQMENEFYRVTLNPKTGGIQSIYDKQLQQELVDPDGGYDLGELIYVTGGEGTYAIHSNLEKLPPPQFSYHRQTGSGIKSVNGPVFGELDSESAAENFPKITMRVRLYHGVKQLDLVFELDKSETMNKEAVYLSFPFAMDPSKGGNSGLWLEYPDEITEPLKDQHASACRDWYSVQRWLAVSDGNSTVEVTPLDAPLFTIGDMTASTWPRSLTLKRGRVFAYIMNNYWHTNYKAKQGGHFVFRYSLTSSAGGFSPKDAVVKGWNMYCPPVAQSGLNVSTAHKWGNSAPAKSLVSVEPQGLPLTTIKQSEDGRGYVFRLCDYSGAGGKAKLELPESVHKLFNCNLVETIEAQLKERGKDVTVPVLPFAPVTVKAVF